MQAKQYQDILCWHCGSEDLKDAELVSGLVQRIAVACDLRSDNTYLQLVVVELINNALDHGVLKLQSTLKSRADGFALYYKERERRLRELNAGWLEVSIELVANKKLCLRVLDSGDGFDYRSDSWRHVPYKATGGTEFKHSAGGQNERRSSETYGRGLTILRELCETVVHVGCGNEVVVEIDLETLNQSVKSRQRVQHQGPAKAW